MDASVCGHGVMAGTHCDACEHSRKTESARRTAELATRLRAAPDTCPHGVLLTGTCEPCQKKLQEASLKRGRAVQMAVAPTGLSPSEAVYGVLAWLTCSDPPVSFGGDNDCAKVGRLADEFCKANGLGELRPNWGQYLTHPSGPPTDHEAPLVELPAGQSE